MLKTYIQLALKVLMRRKFFTFISLFAISFTLVVLMVSTAILDHVFAPHMPEMKVGRTLGVYGLAMSGPNGAMMGGPGYWFLNREIRSLKSPERPFVEEVSIVQSQNKVASFIGDRKVEMYLKRTDGEFWRIFEFRFLEGQPYSARDEAERNFVAVINEATREKFFGGEKALGRTFTVDSQSFRVVGVVENVAYTRIVPFSDVWVPISTNKSDSYKAEVVGGFMGVILARDKAAFPAIKEEVSARIRRTKMPDPKEFTELRGGADTFFESVSRLLLSHQLAESQPQLLRLLILVLAVLFMLLPTTNLVNVNLSRIMERASEIGVRKAFGASSRTLVGQFVVENIVLAVVGGAIGLLLSAIALAALNGSGGIPYADFSINFRVFFYAIAITIAFGMISGVYPAFRMSRLNPVEALRGRSK